MKLREYSTPKGADVLISILPEIGKITSDKKYIELMAEIRESAADEAGSAKGIFEIIALLLSEHRETAWSLLGILNDKTIEDITEQEFGETLREMVAMLNDVDILGFFLPSSSSVKKTQSDTSQK